MEQTNRTDTFTLIELLIVVAIIGILAALIIRSHSGRASPVEVSLFDSMTEWMSAPLYFSMGAGRSPQRAGARHATIASYGPYSTAGGGAVVVAVQNERDWHALCTKVLARPNLVEDERFVDNVRRVENRNNLDEILNAYCSGKAASDLARELDAAGIANGQINRLIDVAAHPELQNRLRWTKVGTEHANLEVLRSPLDRGTAPTARCRTSIPVLGEHTEAVLHEIGMDISEIAASGRADMARRADIV